MSDVIGKCFICKKDVTEHDVAQLNMVRYCELWPGDHFCCAEHPGVEDDYARLLAKSGKVVTNGDTKDSG